MTFTLREGCDPHLKSNGPLLIEKLISRIYHLSDEVSMHACNLSGCRHYHCIILTVPYSSVCTHYMYNAMFTRLYSYLLWLLLVLIHWERRLQIDLERGPRALFKIALTSILRAAPIG